MSFSMLRTIGLTLPSVRRRSRLCLQLFIICGWAEEHIIEEKNPRVLIYFGGANVYYDKLRESVDAGFPELEFGNIA